MTNEIQNSHGTPAGSEGTADSSARGMPAARWRIPPWGLVVAGGFLFCVAFAVFLGIISLLRPGARPVVRGIQERTMPDGTILVLEKVTVGTSHQFDWQRKQSLSEWVSGSWTQRHTANAWAPGEAVVVWLSRRDPASGACLDFDWWLRCAAVDDRGGEIDDDHGGRNSFSSHGSSGISGTRPFSPEPAGTHEMIVVYSALPTFRHRGDSFKLRVYDTKNAVVAEFDVPHTISATLPSWKPEPLPATKKADDLDVTLERLSVQPFESHEGARKVTRQNITPVLKIARGGEPVPSAGAQEFVFEDVFGNTSGQWNTRLNPHEPAWKLKIKLWPGEKASPDPSHERSVAGVPLAEAKTANLIRQNLVVQGVALEFVAVGGAEKVIYTDSSATGNGSSSSGGSFDGSTFQVENRSSGGVVTTTVDNKWPHLFLHCTGLDQDHRLVVRVRDDQGGDVPVQQVAVSDQIVVFMKPSAGATAVDVTFAVQKAKNVEFIVKPPAIDAARPGDPRDSLSK